MGTHTIARRGLGALSAAALIAATAGVASQPGIATAANSQAVAAPTTYTTTDGALEIPDGGVSGNPAIQTITVTGAQPELTHLVVSVNVNHAYANDLVATVESPDGRVADLTVQPRNFSYLDGVYSFDDTATDQLGYADDLGPMPAPPGPYRATTLGDQPVDLDAAFRGVDPNGTWTISVADLATSDTGTLRSSSVTITAVPVGCLDAEDGLTGAKARLAKAKSALRDARKSGNERRIERAKKRLATARSDLAEARADVRTSCR